MNNNGFIDDNEGNGSIHSIVNNLHTIAENYDTITPTKSHTLQKVSTTAHVKFNENADTSYNPYDFGKCKHPTSFYGTIFHLFLISAGPALLALPKIYSGAGNMIGFFGTLFVIGLYNYCCHIFTKVEFDLCKQKRVPNMSYPDTIYHSFLQGPGYLRICATYARCLTYLVFVIPWLGGNSLNLLIIAENLILAWKLLFNYDIDLYTVLMYTFVPLLLLCWIPNLKYLVPISMFGNILNIFVILIVFYHTIVDPPIPQQSVDFNILNIPIFFGSVLFCINAMAILMPLKNDMKHPHKFTLKFGVLNIGNLSIAILYATFNLLCCLKYGNTLLDNVVMNLPLDQLLTKFTILMYVIAICFQFPLISYVVFDLFWNILLKEKKAKLNNLLLWEYVARSVVVIGAYAAAVAIPNITLFIIISGTLASPIDGYILPCIIDEIRRYREHKCVFKFDNIFVRNFLIICFGIIFVISGLISCVGQFMN